MLRTRKARRWAWLAAVLAVVAVVSACTRPAQPPAGGEQQQAQQAQPQPQAGTPADALVIGVSQDVDTLDPAVTMTNNSWAITYPAYERLVRYKTEGGKGSTEVEPSLATGWDVSDDGLTWTFQLRTDARFADGAAVTADAVKYSFDRLKAIANGPADAFPTLDRVEVVDPATVRFVLSGPFPPFLYTLANNGASIVNPAVAKANEKDGDWGQAYLSEHTAGSGPYQLAEWAKDQHLKLEPNPNYAGPAPAFKQVLFKVVKDAAARRLQLEKGDLDVAESLPLDMLDQLKSNPDIQVLDFPSLSVTYLYVNAQRPALNDPRVRQALSFATDYQGIIEGVMLGRAKQMRGPVPEGMWSQDPGLFQYSFDIDKAKALLQGAGATGLKLGYLYADRDPSWEPIGLSLQSTLGQLGIQVEMQKLAYATMREKLEAGDFDLAVGNWSPDFADPYMFMNYWFDSNNFGLAGNRSFYRNDQVDQLIREAATITDQAERTGLYQQAQQIVVDEAAYIYLFQKNHNVAMRKSVQGYVFNPMLIDMYNVESMHK